MTAGFWMALGAALMLALVWARGRFAGFQAQVPRDYVGLPGEGMDLRRHLNGPMVADGVIYGPTGRVVSRFTADFEGRWEGNRGELIEHFHYASGEEEHRTWQLTLGNDGGVQARAHDVVGAGAGRMVGPTLQMQYRLRLPDDAGGHVLNANDWMYLTPDGTIVNRSQFRKFGLKIVELVAVIRPKEIV